MKSDGPDNKLPKDNCPIEETNHTQKTKKKEMGKVLVVYFPQQERLIFPEDFYQGAPQSEKKKK